MRTSEVISTSARRANGRRAVIEALENRQLLSSVVVTSASDATGLPNGLISLRTAIAMANASSTPTTITFGASAFSSKQTILLIHGVLDLTNVREAITITGPSAGVIVNGNNESGVFFIGPNVHAAISNMAVTGGNVTGSQGGGGIDNFGNLTLTNVSVYGNATHGGSGGGVANSGTAIFSDVTISGNASSVLGGGLSNSGIAKLTNVTISGNSASANGGGIENTNAATLLNVTVSANTANFAGGIETSAGLSMGNSIVAGNTALGGGAPDISSFQTIVNSFGGNLIGKSDESSGWSSTDLTGTIAHPLNPKLGPLANNGGPTQTMLPLAGSPAINAGLNSLVPAGVTKDQRGLPRVSGANVDIGSVEVQAATTVTGTVFDDANKNGKKDSTELGLAGWKVYDDANNNGKFDAGEPFTFTTTGGVFSLSIPGTGTAKIRQIVPANWSQTTPAANAGISVTLAPGSTKPGYTFGDYTAVKYLSTVATSAGLVGWWTFDTSSQANSIINGYTGSLLGGAKISGAGGGSPILGESSNTGLVLNGTSGYVNTDLTTQQEFTTAATVNVWINLGSTPAQSGHIYTIAAKSQFANDLDLQMETDGKIHFYSDNSPSDSFTPTSLTGWHMITAEYDTNANIRNLFFDGKEVVANSAYTATRSPSVNAFSIGESDVFTGRFFKGSIDEVSLWNRALNGHEVASLYTAATGHVIIG